LYTIKRSYHIIFEKEEIVMTKILKFIFYSISFHISCYGGFWL